MSLDPPTRAAFIGAFATILSVLGALVGVYVNLAWNRKKHRDEKSYNLRRDVYLQTLDSIRRGFVSLVERSMPKNESKPEQSDTASEFSAACAKVHLIGSKRVVEAIIGLERTHSRFSREVSTRKWNPAERLKTYESALDEFNVVNEGLERLSNEQTDIVKQVEAFNTASSTDTIEGEKLTGLVKAWEAKKQALIVRLRSLAEVFETKTVGDVEKVADAIGFLAEMQKQVEPLFYELIVAMKKDLGIKADERWYFQRMLEESKESEESIRHHVETISAVRRLQKKLEQLERLVPATQQTNVKDSEAIRREEPQAMT
jgi:hypothetical protein